MDWHELEKMRVDDLRAMAKEKELVEAVAGLTKGQLVEKIAQSLGIPRPHRVVDTGEKASIKQRIRELKRERDEALAAGDRGRLHRAQQGIHRHKRALRRMAHVTH
jgi:fructose-1,6-bisphosphatase/sedoheptulose 1,7-bisphosphatase-like protein